MSWWHLKNLGSEDDIIEELLILDELCTENGIQGEFIIVGGSSLVIILSRSNKYFRSTGDIDIYTLATDSRKIFEDILVNELEGRINTDVETHLMPDADTIVETKEIEPFNHELFKNIKPFIPTPEMFVTIKSFASRRVDMDDVLETGILDIVDVEKTIKLIEEYKTYIMEQPDDHWPRVLSELKKRL